MLNCTAFRLWVEPASVSASLYVLLQQLYCCFQLLCTVLLLWPNWTAVLPAAAATCGDYSEQLSMQFLRAFLSC
jgi:hypothetical protein